MTRRGFLNTAAAVAPVAPMASLAQGPSSPPQIRTGDDLGKQKMVLIGAGSAMFTQGLIIDWLRRRYRGEWEIALVDINPVILEATDKMVRRYMLSAENPARIAATVDRREVLPGATLVVSTIGVGSRRAWEQDVFIPRKYGIFQPVGDSVMAGGVARSMRMIPPMLDISRDVHRMCPQAHFINYSNPMTSIVRAIRRETQAKVDGLCIGLQQTLAYLARLADVPMTGVSARWCGVNHLTWITDFRFDGKDMWPKLRDKVAVLRKKGVAVGKLAKGFVEAGGRPPRPDEAMTTPFSWDLFDEFGAFPAVLDRHTIEFFPERFPRGQFYGATLGVDVYSVEATIANGDKIYEQTISLAKGEGPVEDKRLKSTSGEHSQLMDILDSWMHDGRRWYSVNTPNEGAVSNLPAQAVLEMPGVAAWEGMVVPPVGEVSPRIAAVLLRRAAVTEATVEAAVTGDRKMFTEALVMDGVPDYPTAQKLTEEFLKAQKEHLPQFA
jgi:alpha-galactosidase